MFYLVMISMSAAIGSVRGSCTNASIHKAMICTANLQNGLLAQNSPSTFISQGDADMAILACGNGDLLTAINCIERVMEECKNDNTDAAHFLRKMIDIETARRSVNFFCTNVRVYTANADCIARHHKDQDICAQEAKKNYETQASATLNMDVLMRFQCIFYHVVVECLEKVLKKECSSEVADIVKTVIVGFEPPICSAISGGVKAESAGTYDVDTDESNGDKGKGSSSNIMINILLLVISSLMLAL